MDFNQYPKPLREAIHEIAETNAGLHMPSSITADDCEEYAKDDDVQVAFWAMQMAVGDAAESWSDIYEKLTEAERTMVFCSIAVKHPAALLPALRAAVVAHISEWLADAATLRQDDPDSGIEVGEVEQTTRPGYYRELARASTAAYRTNTEQYFDV